VVRSRTVRVSEGREIHWDVAGPPRTAILVMLVPQGVRVQEPAYTRVRTAPEIVEIGLAAAALT